MNLKLRRALVSAVLGVLVILLAPAFAETEGTIQQDYSDQCLISSVFNDPNEMAKTVSDPAKFMQLITVMSNPATAQAVMGCSNSMQMNVLMSNMSNPAKMMNAMAVFMNPAVYMNWMTASMNPQTYQPFYIFMNPTFYMQWMAVSISPSFDKFPLVAETAAVN